MNKRIGYKAWEWGKGTCHLIHLLFFKIWFSLTSKELSFASWNGTYKLYLKYFAFSGEKPYLYCEFQRENGTCHPQFYSFKI